MSKEEKKGRKKKKVPPFSQRLCVETERKCLSLSLSLSRRTDLLADICKLPRGYFQKTFRRPAHSLRREAPSSSKEQSTPPPALCRRRHSRHPHRHWSRAALESVATMPSCRRPLRRPPWLARRHLCCLPTTSSIRATIRAQREAVQPETWRLGLRAGNFSIYDKQKRVVPSTARF